MAIGWIIFGVVAVLTTVLGAFVYTKKRGTIRASIGRGLKNGRKKLFRKNVTESKRAFRARKTRKRSTPRGKVKAKRRAAPPGLFVPHVRSKDDPRVPVRVARTVGTKTKAAAGTARDRTRTAWANRKAKRSETKAISTGPRKLFPGEGSGTGPSHLCNATTKRGTKCRHPVLNGRCAAGHSSGTAA